LVDACVKENASSALSQEKYKKKYNALLARYEKAAVMLNELAAEKKRRRNSGHTPSAGHIIAEKGEYRNSPSRLTENNAKSAAKQRLERCFAALFCADCRRLFTAGLLSDFME